ncbi:MAG: SDR family oxidoreductase [Actinomycetaceae bacterium]|nr:SDR family oxidoreductase [Actinomycetaceae bacterium]
MNPFDLTGKTAVVTGGARGLGVGVTRSLLAAGSDVIIMSRGTISSALYTHARECGRNLRYEKTDLADRQSVERAAGNILAENSVDILVNNAGTQDRHPAVDFPIDSWDRVLQTNLTAVFQLCQIFGAPMVERGDGKIINLASLLSFQGGITVPAYAASKGAVAQLTKALCNEWSAHGVNVNAIAPGYMATDMNEQLIADPVRSTEILSRIPAGRWGKAEDIGDTVVFLASRAAAYIHGHILVVDGGWMAR